MAVPKIKGIETEFSAVMRDKDGYQPARLWDLDKMINIVRRYFRLSPNSREESIREVENPERIIESDDLSRLIRWRGGAFHHNLLPNGARLYIDGTHLEYSTAECLSAKTLAAADRAGETLAALARKILNTELAKDGEELIIRKDNSDRNGVSYACHENYLVSRAAFSRIVNHAALEVGYLAAFFVCRLLFTGSGKMGIEADRERLAGSDAVYQISQRADFIKTLLSECTISNRALVNTRDEPMADEQRFGRLHVICGDANMAEVAKYMKVGITSIVLKMIEDNFLRGDIIVDDPVNGIKLVSRDLTGKQPVLETLEGRRLSAIDLNEEFLQRAKNYFSTVQEPSAEEKDLLIKWEETISDFRTGNEARLRRRFDWKLKQMIFDYFLEAHGIPWQDIEKATVKNGRRHYRVVDELAKKDILYHDLNAEKGLYLAAKDGGDLEEVVTREDVIELIKNPPPECRSYFRGRCLAKFSDDIDMVDWHRIIFKSKRNGGRRGKNFSISFYPSSIELADPVWGSQKDTEEILDKSTNYEDLLKELQRQEEVSR